jgi:hypothetical protein
MIGFEGGTRRRWAVFMLATFSLRCLQEAVLGMTGLRGLSGFAISVQYQAWFDKPKREPSAGWDGGAADGGL